MRVRPAKPGLLIPDPDAPATDRWLPAEGRVVPDTEYWRRRLADGDVVPARHMAAQPRPTAPPRAARPRRAEQE